MFSFFKKKESEIKIIDKIVMTREAKWKAISLLCKNDKNIVLIFWFYETLRQAESFFDREGNSIRELIVTKEINPWQLQGKQAVFAEHYPLYQKEKEFFEKLQLKEVQVWSALDEPLFRQFGSEKIIQMMQKMGMKEDEVIEHKLISNAIQSAQEKISKKILIDQSGSSQEEWMQKNWTNT